MFRLLNTQKYWFIIYILIDVDYLTLVYAYRGGGFFSLQITII